MARKPRSVGVSRYSVATQRAQGRTVLQPTSSAMGRRRGPSSSRQAPSTQMLAVKQEELDDINDVDPDYVPLVDPDRPHCTRHNRPLDYMHSSQRTEPTPRYKVNKIRLKEGEFIVRGEPCVYHIDEFSGSCLWGNEVRLYNQNVCNLRKIVKKKESHNYYYVCRMTNTFATHGKRMYFKVPFSKNSLFLHMDEDQGELPISNEHGTVNVTARFIKGLDDRATITKNWSSFFRQAKMKKGSVYAFAFECSSSGLRMVVYAI